MKYIGLTEHEVNSRIKTYGKNVFVNKEKNTVLLIILSQFKSPLIYILALAAGISVFIGEVRDSILIFSVVIVNAVIGFFQEYKAEEVFDKLQAKITKRVKVIRDSKKVEINIEDLVPGDLVLLEPGLRIPADGILKESNELEVDESVITGESEPVQKNLGENSEILTGSLVINGVGIYEVTKTGMNTQFGKITHSLTIESEVETPVKRQLQTLSKWLIFFIVILIIFLMVIGFIYDRDQIEIFKTAVALSVGLIPEGLLIALTVTLAIGMNRIMSKNAIVKNLPAAETLGSVDILCVDKTGTLTEGRMSVSKVWFIDSEKAMEGLVVCNNDVNFIDRAVKKYILDQKGWEYFQTIQNSRENIFPFSSKLKYSAAYTASNIFIVGAPEVVLSLSKNVGVKEAKMLSDYAQQGFRVLAIAFKPRKSKKIVRSDLKNFTFNGFVMVKDPIRQNLDKYFTKIHSAGVEIKIITGDLKDTTRKIMSEIKYEISDDQYMSGSELNECIEAGADISEIVYAKKVFYRTTPDQKFIILKALQSKGMRVGMMGDGVNDAPALKRAEIGITVDNATDVSKEVSDIVLLDSNFQTIIDSIEEGRNIFKNLRKIMVFLLSDSLSETILITLALIFNMPLPLLPVQILWINLIEDGLPSLALSFDRNRENLLTKENKKRSKNIFDIKVLSGIFIISSITNIIYFTIFIFMIKSGYATNIAQTFVFSGLSISSLLFLFSAKTLDTNIWSENIFNNKLLNISIVVGFLLLILGLYIPPFKNILQVGSLNLNLLLIAFVVSLINIIIIEIGKIILRKLMKLK